MTDAITKRIEEVVFENINETGVWETKVDELAELVQQDRNTTYQILRKLKSDGKIDLESRGRAGVRIRLVPPDPERSEVPDMMPFFVTSHRTISVEEATEVLKNMTGKQLSFIAEFVIPKIIRDKKGEEKPSL